MKSIILTKSHPTIQLAHLYEHLFVGRINQFFYDKGLFKYLDYTVAGTTWDNGGIIIINCDLYSKAAINLIDDIVQLRIQHEDGHKNVSRALTQIVAEEAYTIYVSDSQIVLDELEMLNQQPWQNLDSFSTLDTKTIRQKSKPIYLTTQLQSKPRELKLSLVLDEPFAKDNRRLLPLFNVLSHILLYTLSDRVSATTGTYVKKIGEPTKPTRLTSRLLVSRQEIALLDLQDISIVAHKTIEHAVNDQTLQRIVEEFSSVSYNLRPNEAPNTENMLRDCGILIGSKGWKDIATHENLSKLLSNMSMSIRFGKNTQTIKLSSKK